MNAADVSEAHHYFCQIPGPGAKPEGMMVLPGKPGVTMLFSNQKHITPAAFSDII